MGSQKNKTNNPFWYLLVHSFYKENVSKTGGCNIWIDGGTWCNWGGDCIKVRSYLAMAAVLYCAQVGGTFVPGTSNKSNSHDYVQDNWWAKKHSWRQPQMTWQQEESNRGCSVQDMDEQGFLGDPICVSTLSSHCRGPFRCNSIQHGVDVTVCLLYSAPHPFTKLILIVHIRVSW